MNEEIKILIVEDAASDVALIERELRRARIGFISHHVHTRDAFVTALREFAPAVVLSDYNLPQFSGSEALRLLKQLGNPAPFILITGSLTEEVAVECMKEGAHDYILKTSLTRLPSAVLSALEKMRTIEEKRRAEAALRLSEEQLRMSQKLEAVGQLAGGVAHDFNNLLTVISGYSELVLNRLSESDDNRPKVQEIKRAAERASSLTRQLLAFSRKQVLQPKLFDLNHLVTDMSNMLRRLIGENIEMTTVIGQTAPINADPGQIEQVLMNLVVNARDAMPNGGQLTIETARVEIDETYARTRLNVQTGPYVMLAVSDNGCGMDAETRKRIFEPFFTTKEQGKGTGLGLSTVYGIVQQSGGNIWSYSEPGQGSVFKVYLPEAAEPEAQPGATLDGIELPRGIETVLIVEDEPQIRTLAVDCLSEYGYAVLCAANGLEAVQLIESFRGGPIDLVLTDVVMPNLSGRELSDRVTMLQPSAKVLFMSGYTNDSVMNHGIMDGETWFIQKPFTLESLVRRVREVLDDDAPRTNSTINMELSGAAAE